MIADVLLWAAAALCFTVVARLGTSITRRSLLAPIDAKGNRLRGHGTRIAVMFTRAGYAPALTIVSIVVFSVARALHWWPAFALLLPIVQLLAQALAHLIKQRFRRIRPDDWLYRPELGFSYPSGHATTAALFYGGLFVYAWSVPAPLVLQIVVSLVLLVPMTGIPWSRLVLGAHYGTDVIGGFLLGTGCLCLLIVLLRHMPALPTLG